MKTKKFLIVTAVVAAALTLLGIAAVFGINAWVKGSVEEQLLSVEAAGKLEDVDCIVVLGCQVREDGSLSHMLRDRLLTALEVYEAGAAPKLLMSGDHGQKEYDEVNAMKSFAMENGIPSENIFMDHAGFSTYETVYRAKEIFGADKVVIVTQEYHLYRALYIAERMDMEAWGVAADRNRYAGQTQRDIREILARCKDFVMCIFKPEPTYLGETIPVSGNGDLTND